MKKIYSVKLSTGLNTTIQASNRREAKAVVEEMATAANAAEWYFELA